MPSVSVPTRTIPDDQMPGHPDLGYARKVSSAKARRLLHREPRPAEEAIVAAGRSLTE
jgi:hypothetical protein